MLMLCKISFLVLKILMLGIKNANVKIMSSYIYIYIYCNLVSLVSSSYGDVRVVLEIHSPPCLVWMRKEDPLAVLTTQIRHELS